MIQFHYPELFLLAIPLWFLFRRWGWTDGVTGWIRIGLVSLFLFAITGPMLNWGGVGIDVIIVADRSRSMPTDSHEHLRELIKNLENNRGVGDRLALITFGSHAEREYLLSNNRELQDYKYEINPDGTDLNEAIAAALDLTDRNRPARILVLSDGEANGASPLSSARRAREQGVPIDFRLFERQHVGDAAIESVQLPQTIAPQEPFQFSVLIHADKNVSATVHVLRNGIEFATQETGLQTGMNRLLFRDMVEQSGFYNYSVRLEVPDDPLLENNRGAGVVRVDGGPKILVLSNEKTEGNLVRALRSAQLNVDIALAKEHPLTQDALDPYRVVIIENVPASAFGRLKMERLRQFCKDLGGGILLTGGQRSFGAGGYFNSPLDDVLPVSMELREEQRKTRVALAIALDRSGSMTAPVAGGKTKMDLANVGTAECVKLLGAGDSVAVIAVDSAPHVIVPMQNIDDPIAIGNKIKKIQSMGGGIYVYEALVAAGRELSMASQATRHIILFSDAADSENPANYKKLLKKFEGVGITVSVIGLGTDRDTDANLLKDIAKLGNGNIMFTDDAKELPRLFTEDTMSVARSSFITKEELGLPAISGNMLPDARLMGEFHSGPFPTTDGYNLTYLKPDATLAVQSKDEYQAPWSAFWYRGLGRVVAITLEVDGQYSGQFGDWNEYADYLVTNARWLMGSGHPDDVFVDVQHNGQDAVVTVELDPERQADQQNKPPEVIVVPPGKEPGDALKPDFIWTGPDTLQARFTLEQAGTYRTIVKTDERELAQGPAVTLPYSPEFVPRVGMPTGPETLASIAELSGGVARTDILEVFKHPPRSARTSPLLPWLLILGLILLITEIAGRRLSLWEHIKTEPERATAQQAQRPSWKQWMPRICWPQRATKRKPAISPARETAIETKPEHVPTTPTGPPKRVNVYEQAKQRAKRRTK